MLGKMPDSADIEFLELPSKFSGKRSLLQIFLFTVLNSLQPPSLENCQNLLSMMQTFCWCSLNEQSTGIDGIAASSQSSQNFKQNVTF